jgi:hypothetical protein
LGDFAGVHLHQGLLEEVVIKSLHLWHQILQRVVDLIKLVNLHAQLFHLLGLGFQVLNELLLSRTLSTLVLDGVLWVNLHQVLALDACSSLDPCALGLRLLDLNIKLLLFASQFSIKSFKLFVDRCLLAL